MSLPRLPWLLLLAAVFFSAGCRDGVWNNPYPASAEGADTHYSSFSERPKHLDPARSYASNEWAIISQVYEPPLQYHFLKRPYELTPLTAVDLPEVRYLDADGQRLEGPEGASYTDYLLVIQPGIFFEPHPAFARGADGDFVYGADHPELAQARRISDFSHTATRELIADDYVYQIKRLAAPALHSPIASLMAEHIDGFAEFSGAQTGSGGERGEDEMPASADWQDLRALPMRGVEAFDRYGLRIRIKGVYPQFVYWLAMNFFAPMPWEAERFFHLPGLAEKNISLDWFPVGTGPYRLTENNPNLRMVLEANPNFHGERYPMDGEPGDEAAGVLDDAGRVLPLVERAVYSLEKESIPRWNKFLQGYYDVSGIGSDSFDQAIRFGAGGEADLTAAMKDRGIRLVTSTATSIYFTGFNMIDPVVGGDSERARLLRRAIAIALDTEEFISIFRNGRALVGQGPLPPGIFGHRGDASGVNAYIYDLKDGRPVRKSVDEARRLLARAGYKDGIDPATGAPLVLYYDSYATGPDSMAYLNWYRKQFQKLGIQLVVRATDYNRFQDKVRKGDAQILSWGWNADYPDPENFFFLLYGPHAKTASGGENSVNYQNAEFDALFDRMKTMENGSERLAIIDRMQEILHRDTPWIAMFYPVDFVLHHAWYANTKPNLMANNTLKYKRIDGGLRAESRRQWNRPVIWPLAALGVLLLLSLVPAVVVFRRRERSAAR